MSELRFDGRTAVVTGAGGNPSLGRAHALVLAARGANVVVNDIGRDPETPGYAGTASAEAVVQEIRASGGNAIADVHSVASEAGATAIVQAAVAAFGGIDILINNAGISIAAGFDEMTSRDFQRHIDINLMGPVWMCRAAWPHMRSKSYGRIVNIGSGAFTGFASLSAYGSSKGGVFSLTRALAAEGASLGIKVNAVNPGAFTRMVAAQQEATSSMYRYAQQQSARRARLPGDRLSGASRLSRHRRVPRSGRRRTAPHLSGADARLHRSRRSRSRRSQGDGPRSWRTRPVPSSASPHTTSPNGTSNPIAPPIGEE